MPAVFIHEANFRLASAVSRDLSLETHSVQDLARSEPMIAIFDVII
jgi:hypothetical protein